MFIAKNCYILLPRSLVQSFFLLKMIIRRRDCCANSYLTALAVFHYWSFIVIKVPAADVETDARITVCDKLDARRRTPWMKNGKKSNVIFQ